MLEVILLTNIHENVILEKKTKSLGSSNYNSRRYALRYKRYRYHSYTRYRSTTQSTKSTTQKTKILFQIRKNEKSISDPNQKSKKISLHHTQLPSTRPFVKRRRARTNTSTPKLSTTTRRTTIRNERNARVEVDRLGIPSNINVRRLHTEIKR